MKSISEAKWEVELEFLSRGGVYWAARLLEVGGTDGGVPPVFYGNDYKTEQGAKNSWKRFAKLNKIKNWEWV